MFKLFHPRSVIDVGCGVGTWLRAARELGVTEIVGIDGDYVDQATLMIDPSEFIATDLEHERLSPAAGLEDGRRFDLVISVEVAEHLSLSRAETFVEDLTRLGDLILFSAAIPFQGGVHHVNEQWPEFWALLFRGRGFECLDPIRPRIWANPDVEWWYAQNVLLFARSGSAAVASIPRPAEPSLPPLSIVHAENYLAQILRWFHIHRLAATDEEFADLKALRAAYQSGAGFVPALQAPARAAATPDRLDVFPHTRTERIFPEPLFNELNELRNRLDALQMAHADLTTEHSVLAGSYEGLRAGYDKLGEESKTEIEQRKNDLRLWRRELETQLLEIQLGLAELAAVSQRRLEEVAELAAVSQRRLEEVEKSRAVRFVRLMRRWYAIYSRSPVGRFRHALRRGR